VCFKVEAETLMLTLFRRASPKFLHSAGCGESGFMACRLCGSDKQTKFGTEINIHIPGMKNLDKPPVLVFPKLLVCLSCGFAECTFPENELLHLTKASTASWSERSLSATPANPLDQLSRAKFL